MDNISVGANQMRSQENRAFMRPKVAIGFFSILALFQIVRVSALTIVQGVIAGKYSEAWIYPGMVDIAIGVAAPFIAYALWKKTGLGVWTIAIVFFVLSIFDHMDAITVAARTMDAIPPGLPSDKIMAVLMLSVSSIIELFAIKLLVSRKLKSYYLGMGK